MSPTLELKSHTPESSKTDLRNTPSPAVQTNLRRMLEAVAWCESGELLLRFQGSLTYSITPETLLLHGVSALTVEGYRLELSKSGSYLRVLVPELQLSLERNPAVA